MPDALIRLTATEAVARLKRREITPLDLIEAAALRIAAIDPALNALPTRCLDRARGHARRIMAGEGTGHADHPGWLAGLPPSCRLWRLSLRGWFGRLRLPDQQPPTRSPGWTPMRMPAPRRTVEC